MSILKLKSFSKKKLLLTIVVIAMVTVGAITCIENLSGKTVYISGSIVEKSLDDLYEQSTLIAFGSITGKSEAFQIKNVSGSIANFTDYYFQLDNTLRGNAERDTITVRIQGGTVDNYTEIYEFSPDLKIGNKYLLFLYKPGRGGAYNTEGDYYYVLGLTQGSFYEDNTGDFVSESGTVLTKNSLISTLDTYSKKPINEDYFRNEYIENQKRNLKNGFITQEEFDEMMINIDNYAIILE